MTAVLAVYNSRGCVVRLSKLQSVDQRMRLGMRCRLSPIADVPSHTSGAGMCPSPNLFDHLVGASR